jgi:putative GTP pyrophosphokinase
MPDSQNRASIEDVLAEFDSRHEVLTALCAKTKSLIEASLQDANIRYQSVQARVKTKKKLKEKYLDSAKKYLVLDDITDLAGLRVITYYEDDVDRVAEIIRREFTVDSENSVDKRDTEPDRFGYSAVNFVCTHLGKRTSDVEYKKFDGVRCEVQVTSILSHAWAEIEHEWYDLRDAYPDEIKRRFSRLAALFDLADSEFLDIRKARTSYERSVALRVESMSPDLAIDPLSLKTFIEQETLVVEIDKSIAPLIGLSLSEKVLDASLNIRSAALKFVGLKTLQEVRDALARFRTKIPEFVVQCKKENLWGPSGTELSKGVSVWQLANFMASLGGPDEITKFYGATEVAISGDIARQAAIATEIVRR